MLDQLRFQHEVLAEIHDLASSASAGDSHYRLNLISIKAGVAARCSSKFWAAVAIPEEMRARHPLISTAPKYRQYLAAKAAREIVQRLLLPMAIVRRLLPAIATR